MPRDSDDPLIGRVLAGRYQVEALIDRGGMGRVYRAIQQPLGRPVALKTLDLSDPRGEFKQRFLNEAEVQGRLSHPNTVRMFDYGRTEDGLYYITMELLEGESLKHVVKREAPLDPLRVVRISRQICRALHEAHEIGVVHRDLKPGNVFLTVHGSTRYYVKLLDFGLVKDLEAAQDLSHTGQTLGSPMYMAPEQVEGEPVDRRTDIYALGIVMWVALTGKQPFPKGSIATVMLHQVSTPLPDFAEVEVDVPHDLERLVQDCSAKEKDGRPASMELVERRLAAIENRLAGIAADAEMTVTEPAFESPLDPPRPIAAPAPPPASGPGWLGFALVALSLGVLAIGLVLAVVGIGGGGVALWAVTNTPPPPEPELPEPSVEEVYSRITGLLRCSEVVVSAPERGLVRGRIVMVGTPRVGLRGPEARLDATTVRSQDSGRVEIEVAAGEPGAPVEFEVVCPELVTLTTDSGDVSVGRVTGEAFSIVSGAGNVTLAGAKVETLDVLVEFAGDVDLGTIEVGRLAIELQGSGDLTGAGTARELQVNQLSSGDTSLYELAATRAIVDLKGSGDAEVQALQSLVARTENSGDITYRGTPDDVDARALGSGTIKPE